LLNNPETEKPIDRQPNPSNYLINFQRYLVLTISGLIQSKSTDKEELQSIRKNIMTKNTDWITKLSNTEDYKTKSEYKNIIFITTTIKNYLK